MGQLMLFAGDTHANLLAMPGSDKARKMTATYGRNIAVLSKASGPLGSLEKTLLGTSAWASTMCFLTWKHLATPQGRLLFRLVPSMPDTDATEFGLWATPRANDAEKTGNLAPDPRNGLPMQVQQMWMTPNATIRDGKQSPGSQLSLAKKVKGWRKDGLRMLPTPTRAMHKGSSKNSMTRKTGQSRLTKRLDYTVEGGEIQNGRLNPTWVEWLMGFPEGWTDLEP